MRRKLFGYQQLLSLLLSLTLTLTMICRNPEKFKSRMHSLAYGQAMAAAARDYQKVRRAIQANLGHFSCAIGCISHQHVHSLCNI